ncbi:PAS/PAC and GAF sensor-containing diguanylate cyclase [Salinisphaera dokdonensis CL-ES53]|uniref:diguanylate cyclase n=1 Tax=Salinisphaera dokdonensis CL-ES53 TaxID=1304272 RepID=A0ABV2B1R8_9GAMM
MITNSFGSDVLTSRALDIAATRIFAGIVDGVVLTDENRRIIYTNKATDQMFGYGEDGLIGLSTSTLYEDSNEFAVQGAKRFNPDGPAEHKTYITRYKRKDGTVFDGETTGGPIHEPDTGRVLYLGIVRDVTTRLSAESVLNELHRVTSDRSLDFEARRREILRLGCRHFGLPIGIVSNIDGDRYEVVDAIHPEDAIPAGATFALGETYCCHTLAADEPTGFHHAGRSEIRDHPCYQGFQLESYLGSPITVDGELYGTLNFSSPAPTRPFNRQDLELIGLFAQWLGHELAREADLQALQAAQLLLRRAATTDELTGLANRRLLGDRLQAERQRMNRYDGTFAVALVDFDHFKKLNDHYGHAAGDAALVEFAAIAKKLLRAVDTAGRWGGEEFLILLPNTALEGALTIAQRVANRVHANPLEVGGERIELSVSIGVAISDGNESVEAVIARADAALYNAKADGRNCVRYLSSDDTGNRTDKKEQRGQTTSP